MVEYKYSPPGPLSIADATKRGRKTYLSSSSPLWDVSLREGDLGGEC